MAAIQPSKYSSSTSTMAPRPPRVIRYTVPSAATSRAIAAAFRTRSVTEMILSIIEAYFKHIAAASAAGLGLERRAVSPGELRVPVAVGVAANVLARVLDLVPLVAAA